MSTAHVVHYKCCGRVVDTQTKLVGFKEGSKFNYQDLLRSSQSCYDLLKRTRTYCAGDCSFR